MSFKRDGNDSNLLSKLRKRRINELFGEKIPKDEAKLLSNGRFTCTVCNSNPIFDTVNMLVVHRNGKKHLANQEVHEIKKKELKQLIAVRKHQQFLKDGTTSIPVATTSSDGVLLSAPYDSRVKKAKLRPTERKPRVDFQAQSVENPKSNSSPQTFTLDAVSTLDSELPGNAKPSSSTSRWQQIAKQQLLGPVVHDHQLKNLFAPDKNAEGVKVFPYQTKHVRRSTVADSDKNQNSQYSQHASSSQVFTPHSLSLLKSTAGKQLVDLSTFKKTNPSAQITSSSKSKSKTECSAPLPVAPPPLPHASHSHSHPQFSNLEKNSAYSQLSQKLRQLQGSGWKRDWDGKWIKDENAEFDSDEEPPDKP